MILALRELPGNGDGSGVTTAFLTGGDLELDDDGSYSITLGAERPDVGAWLPLVSGTDNLLVRFTFQDWMREQRGSIAIERLDVADAGRARMTLRRCRRGPRRRGTVDRTAGAVLPGPGNSGDRPPREHDAPTPTGARRGRSCRAVELIRAFDLADDEALVVTIKDAPHAQYHDIMVADPWLNTLEFGPGRCRTAARSVIAAGPTTPSCGSRSCAALVLGAPGPDSVRPIGMQRDCRQPSRVRVDRSACCLRCPP